MFLSIIVPVFNVERYLSECLDSLIDQDIADREYEIICVNDGATDGSGAILEQYRSRCRNLVIVEKENGGLSSARNAGLDAARGDYIWFVDSDDFVQPNILRKLYDCVAASDCDRLVFENVYEYKDKLTEDEYAERACGKLMPNTKYGDGVAWSSLIRRSLIEDRHLRFHKDIPCYGEDLVFNYQLNIVPYRKACCDSLVYYYRRRSGSIMSSHNKAADYKRINVGLSGAMLMRDYYNDEKASVPAIENNNLISDTANLIMFFLRPAFYAMAKLPQKEASEQLKRFKTENLFPFPIPAECTTKTSRMTTKTRLHNKIYDFICLHVTYRWGYRLMRLYNRLTGTIRK